MPYNAVNGSVVIGDTDMDYISFGKGDKHLIMIPGLGDGLRTVKGSAVTLAVMYRLFAKRYKVYVLSRKNSLPEGYTTRKMAGDYKLAMEKLSITKADVMGVSQGGMIAQYMAIDYPDVVDKLVLAVTLSGPNETVKSVVGSWIEMAKNGDYAGILADTAEKSYTEKRLKTYRPLLPLLGRIGKPKDFSRVIIQANACLNHDAYDELHKIKSPTLVIGVRDDKVVGVNSSQDIAAQIAGSKLIIYDDYGHALYDEAKDFNHKIYVFLSL